MDESHGEKLSKDDGWTVSDKPIPTYTRMEQRLRELEEMEKLEKTQQEPTEAGLPERPQKRIQEKFRQDRERIEARLNAKGDSLYQSKRETMTSPWAGAPGVGWGGSQLQPSPWGGWSSQPQSSGGYDGWRGSAATPQESPFTRRYGQSDGNQGLEERSLGERVVFGEENPFDSMEDEGVEDNEKIMAKGEDYDSDEFDNDEEGDGDMFKKAGERFAKGKSNFNNKGEMDEDLESEDITAGGEFGDETMLSNSKDPYMRPFNEREEKENMTNMRAAGGESSLQTTQAEGGQPVDLTEIYKRRPRKQLKEEFMKDREELEAKLNAKGDSMYRRANEPLPGAPAPPEGGPLPINIPERRILSTEEIRAQMMFEKIARAAIKATRKGGKKGKASIVFI